MSVPNFENLVLLTVVVHDSDSVKKVYHDISRLDMVSQILSDDEDKDWRIRERVLGDSFEDEIETQSNITLDDILELYHDGDSEVGFTLKEIPFTEMSWTSYLVKTSH